MDGTLLNSRQEIPEESLQLLRRLIDQGTLFTIATARSAASAQDFCRQLALRLPVVLMNGVFVYDLQKQVYVHKNPIPFDAAEEILSFLAQRNIWPFVFTLEGEALCVDFVHLNNREMQGFYTERRDKAYKRFGPVDHFAVGKEICTVYISVIDTYETLRPVFEWVRAHPKLAVSLYPDNYSDFWYLEVYSILASKATGVTWLKGYTGAERVVVFGDNFNDIAMLKAADEGYVVSEAPEQVKRYATGVIGSNEDSAVARFISGHSPLPLAD